MLRIGHGYDVHRLVEGRKLVLGGVNIPFEKGADGHSDADVLVHAIMDSILGALALGDIGQHFPDTDDTYKDADSIELLKNVIVIAAKCGYTINNIDSTIICQKPKLKDHIPEMRRMISEACGCDITSVSVKATTEEKLGFTGDGSGISAHAVCTLKKTQHSA